jgi:hypothetical protein
VLADVAASRAAIEATGTRVAFVHMGSAEDADRWFARHGLPDLPCISDPSHAIYRAFGLGEGTLFALGHPRVGPRWIQTVLKHGFGWQGAHWRQLTGIFLVHRGAIVGARTFPNSAVRPDYLAFVHEHLR